MKEDAAEILRFIENLPEDEILVKLTGMEEVSLPAHVHGRCQIVFVVSGTLHIEISGKDYFVTDRRLAVIPSGVCHRLSSNNARISLLVCYFSSWKNEGEFSVYRTDGFVAANLRFIGAVENIRREEMPEMFDFAAGFFRLLPHICERDLFPVHPFCISEGDSIGPVLEYIRTNFHRNLTVREVASCFGYSPRTLTRMFTRSKIRFVHYLNYQRVVRAMEIMSDNGSMNIGQTAYEVGFSSPNSFCRVFRQITGESPSMFLDGHRRRGMSGRKEESE